MVCCRGCKQEVDDSCNVTDKTIKKPSQTWNGSGNGTYKNRLGNALNKYKGRHRECTVEVRRRSNTSSYIFIHPLQSFLLVSVHQEHIQTDDFAPMETTTPSVPSPHNKQPESASELINVLSDESHTHDLFKDLLLQSDMGRDAARKVAAIDRDKEQIDAFRQDAEHQRQCHELSNAVALEQTERLAIIEADERNMKSIADTESAVRESLRRRLLPSVLTSKMLRERPTTGRNAHAALTNKTNPYCSRQ